MSYTTAKPFVNLATAAPLLSVPGEGEYIIKLPQTPYLILIVGQSLNGPASDFVHRNVLAKQPVVHEFKYSRQCGGKYWAARPGYNFYFAVPVQNVEVALERGHSFVDIRVNEAVFTLNVSGGSRAGGGWVDLVDTAPTTAVNLGFNTMQKIAAASISRAEFEERGWKLNMEDGSATPTPESLAFCQTLAEYKMRGALNQQSEVYLREDCGTAIAGRKANYRGCSKNRAQVLLELPQFGFVKVPREMVDWVKTAAKAGISIEHQDCRKIVVFSPHPQPLAV